MYDPSQQGIPGMGGPFDGIPSAGIPWMQAAGAVGSLVGTKMMNDANMDNAIAMMNFQSSARRTQYMTAVADLKDAGLNPMLAYMNGGAGNLAGAQAAPMQNTLGAAVQGAAAAADINNKVSQNDLIEAETLKTLQETDTSNATAKQIDAATRRLVQEIQGRPEYGGQSYFERGKMLDLERSFYDTQIASNEAEYSDKFYKARAEGLGAEAELSKLGYWPAKAQSDYSKATGMLSPAIRDFGTAMGGAARFNSAGRAASRMRRDVPDRPRQRLPRDAAGWIDADGVIHRGR